MTFNWEADCRKMCFKELPSPSCEKTESVIIYLRILGGQTEFETRVT